MVQRVAIRIDVGAAVPLELVAQLIRDTSTVCNTALSLDRQSELNRVTRLLPLDQDARIELAEYLRTRRYQPLGEYPDDKLYPYPRRIRDILERLLLSSATFGPPNLWPPAEVQAAYLLNSMPDSEPLVPTVERISYTNPLEIILTGVTWGAGISVGGGSLWWLLKYLRDFGPKREKDRADAQKTRAEATKLEAEAEEARAQAHQIRTEAECKAKVTRALLRRVRDGQAVLAPGQIAEIVDDRAVGAILELTQRPLDIEDQSDHEAG
ncbi:hypothetical protein [Mycobacterium sp. UM_CSW]|uniref:hypothetical protein n=1 Tax=Mycobacterium sp. UM_CSW TaxID=1370119 RepID=UPI000831A28B|nr:hypothetical protein [Mycobacterium sp. UM_CSW]